MHVLVKYKNKKLLFSSNGIKKKDLDAVIANKKTTVILLFYLKVEVNTKPTFFLINCTFLEECLLVTVQFLAF